MVRCYQLAALRKRLSPRSAVASQKFYYQKIMKKDVSDIPEEVRNALTIIHVSTIEEVLREALGIELPECKPVLNRPKGDSNVQLSMVGE